jgi:3-hydroxy acid dehydrogenase/malonic semialdehyde reductase
MSYPRLKDKIVLITGASAGIGASTAKLFAECGSHLILAARREDRLIALKSEIEAKHKEVKIHIAILDVSKIDSVEKMVSSFPKEFSAIDILVNNAGLALGLSTAYNFTLEQLDTVIDTNIKGVLHMIRAIVPGMLERKSGHIINIGSIAGYQSYPHGSIYCASKFAVRAITDALRKELVATPLRVTAINPGLTETEFSLVRFGGETEKAKKPYEGVEPLIGDDVADTIVYAASRPPHVQISDLTIFPTAQASVAFIHREPKP